MRTQRPIYEDPICKMLYWGRRIKRHIQGNANPEVDVPALRRLLNNDEGAMGEYFFLAGLDMRHYGLDPKKIPAPRAQPETYLQIIVHPINPSTSSIEFQI